MHRNDARRQPSVAFPQTRQRRVVSSINPRIALVGRAAARLSEATLMHRRGARGQVPYIPFIKKRNNVFDRFVLSVIGAPRPRRLGPGSRGARCASSARLRVWRTFLHTSTGAASLLASQVHTCNTLIPMQRCVNVINGRTLDASCGASYMALRRHLQRSTQWRDALHDASSVSELRRCGV